MGPSKGDSTESLLVQRRSPRGAPRKPVGSAGEEPEDHKCQIKYIDTKKTNSQTW